MKKYDVLAIGELNVDLILTGLGSMPVIGREILADDCKLVMGSSTAICACGLARLGLKIGFVGKVGQDRFGEVGVESLRSYAIDTSHIIVDPSVSTGMTVSLSMQHDRALVTYLGAIDELRMEDIDVNLLAQTKHVHIGSYFLQSKLQPGIPELFRAAHAQGATTSLDAGWDASEKWDHGIFDALKETDIFVPNETEAQHITRKESVDEALAQLAGYARIVVVKCGSQGASYQSGDDTKTRATFSVKPVDTTGAGDSFNAGFIYGFLKGYDPEKCLDYGNACGAISVTRVGGATSCAALPEVEQLVSGRK